jgi:PIN domain nuclease of toxin-antitoxin system
VIVLDSYAVLAFLKDEPAKDMVEEILSAGVDAILTVLGVAEVVDHLVRLGGVDEEDVVADLASLGMVTPQPLDVRSSLLAGRMRAKHYHRSDRQVSLADCVAAVITASLGGSLATSDPHLLDLCRDESIATVVLPDARGRVWSV